MSCSCPRCRPSYCDQQHLFCDAAPRYCLKLSADCPCSPVCSDRRRRPCGCQKRYGRRPPEQLKRSRAQQAERNSFPLESRRTLHRASRSLRTRRDADLVYLHTKVMVVRLAYTTTRWNNLAPSSLSRGCCVEDFRAAWPRASWRRTEGSSHHLESVVMSR